MHHQKRKTVDEASLLSSESKTQHDHRSTSTPYGSQRPRCDASSIGACRPRIFFINGFLCFLEDEWQRNGERERERRRHFKEKISLEEAHHHRRPWIRAWRKKEMNEGRGREEHEILCSK
ncbi:hypothetical protein GmHk_05G012959 [Glycine max]|nr:hypothetical protein GmHk_05G012959 [Glycine max]